MITQRVLESIVKHYSELGYVCYTHRYYDSDTFICSLQKGGKNWVIRLDPIYFIRYSEANILYEMMKTIQLQLNKTIIKYNRNLPSWF